MAVAVSGQRCYTQFAVNDGKAPGTEKDSTAELKITDSRIIPEQKSTIPASQGQDNMSARYIAVKRNLIGEDLEGAIDQERLIGKILELDDAMKEMRFKILGNERQDKTIREAYFARRHEFLDSFCRYMMESDILISNNESGDAKTDATMYDLGMRKDEETLLQLYGFNASDILRIGEFQLLI